MTNEYYTASGYPNTGAAGSSALMRAELELVEAGLDKMPTLSGNANLAIFVNGSGTGLTSVTASTARTNLGVVIGTDVQEQSAVLQSLADNLTATVTELNALDGITATVTELNYVDGVTSAIQTQLDGKQPLDAGLTSIAGLTTAADRMIYTTGSDTYAVTTLTSFARSILDDANASAARTTLELGTIATQAANNVAITGGSISGLTGPFSVDGVSISNTAISTEGTSNYLYFESESGYGVQANGYTLDGQKQSPSANESRNSTTTLTASTRFSEFTFLITTRWMVDCVFYVRCGSATPDFKWRFSFTGTITNFVGVCIAYTDGSAPIVIAVEGATTDIVVPLSGSGTGLTIVEFHGSFNLNTSATAEFVWAQNVSNAVDVTVESPSYIDFRKV